MGVIGDDCNSKALRSHPRARQVIGPKRRKLRCTGEDVDRPIDSFEQAQAHDFGDRARFHGLPRAAQSLGKVDRRKTLEALRLAQGGKRNEMHHDAAGKPHREQQTE